jgi:transcriptional regulator with XRE-family HTH domain
LSDGNLRDRLLAYRVARGWSQVRTAEEAGVGHATITNIETGANTRPHRATLMKLALAFGVSLDEFLSDRPPKPPGPSLPGEILRLETGHDHLARNLTSLVAEAEGMSVQQIRDRIRELSEEAAALRQARLVPSAHLPQEALETPQALKAAREEIRGVSRGFVVRVMALAEVGAEKEEAAAEDLIAEAERIVAEHREMNVAT